MGANVSQQSHRFEQNLYTNMTNSNFSSAKCIGVQDNSHNTEGHYSMKNCTVANTMKCWTVTDGNLDNMLDTVQKTLTDMASEQANKGINLGQANVTSQNSDVIANMMLEMRNDCSKTSETWQEQNNSINAKRGITLENCAIRNQMQGSAEASCMLKSVTSALQEGESAIAAAQKNDGVSLASLLMGGLLFLLAPILLMVFLVKILPSILGGRKTAAPPVAASLIKNNRLSMSPGNGVKKSLGKGAVQRV